MNEPRARRHRLAALASCSILTTAGLMAGGAIAPAPASAAPCTHADVSVYPGSSPSNIRYGRVDFHFDGCGDQSPSAWQARVKGSQTNATGKNLGFFIDGVSIVMSNSTSTYADFDGTIYASTCVPRVGWPCSRSYTMTANYRLYLDRASNVQIGGPTTSAPSGMAVFLTP